MKSNVFYLNLTKAYLEGYVVNRKKYFEEYSIPEENGYKMLKGCPLLRSIEGTLIYDNDIPELIIGGVMEKHRYQMYISLGKNIILKWKRN